MILLQEAGTLPVPKSLTLGNELSKETHRLTKQESLLGRGTWAECSRIRIPGELLCLVACSLWFYDGGIIFQVVFGQSFWLIILPGGAYIDQPRWMPARRILGVGWTCGVTFWTFPNSSGWCWFISSVFLTTTSYCKTDGYYFAWPSHTWMI